MTKRRIHDADEQDAFTGWRKVYRWKPGELRKIKRRASKRERREGHQQAEEGKDE